MSSAGGSDLSLDGCCFQLHPQKTECDEVGNNNREFPVNDEYGGAFLKKARADLTFEDVRYSVKEWSWRHPVPVKKEILKGVSGRFPAGELTAIMGPSGAGKSTLLNVLAAFTVQGASGNVMVNGEKRDPVKFKKQSCYIQQDDYLREKLTVWEAMAFASHLKLGFSVKSSKKVTQIHMILEMLRLQHCLQTRCGGLSGGQKKRLSIALELISNPPILFLDEPTTGLDSSSCNQCVSLLKSLARQGRTVICTIHQPSSLVFEKFDNLYALADGECMYSGKIKNLVPYLSKFGLDCPQYHNPADYLLDVACKEFTDDLTKLVQTATEDNAKSLEEVRQENQAATKVGLIGGVNNNQYTVEEEDSAHPPSAIVQTFLLTKRKALIYGRSKISVMMRAMAHLLISALFGYLYYDAGFGAKTVLANYVYLYGTNLFLVYTGKMSATLLFPLELLIVTREHFNRWYRLGPYYLSMMIIEVPFQIICCLLYLPLSYYLTGQPRVMERFLLFSGSVILLSIVSQALGFLIGILTPRKVAVFIGPVLACLLSVFGFCLRYSDTPDIFKWLYQISYFRAAFQVSVLSVYGLDRGHLYCPSEEVFCKFGDPVRFLKEMDTAGINLQINTLYTASCFILFHLLTIGAVWYRLNRK